MSAVSENKFLTAPLGITYVRTALPVITVMMMNGIHSVIDAIFLGQYVGPQALAAVTLIFPVFMLLVALSTLVSSGMSSILARYLGAGEIGRARAVFTGAHGLAFAISLGLILAFSLIGKPVVALLANGSQEVADMSLVYLRLTIFFGPIFFLMSVQGDGLRNEGKLLLMAAMSVFSSLANIAFNYLFIGIMGLGVAGSAYGTAAAMIVSLVIVINYRIFGNTLLSPRTMKRSDLTHDWPSILSLGGAQSLSFFGFALGSIAVISALQLSQPSNYDTIVSAYGILTRILGLTFMPILGLAQAMQTITGNNYGARQDKRVQQSLFLALVLAFTYCVLIQILTTLGSNQIGAIFVDDPGTIAELSRILPVMLMVYCLTGPLYMIALHFLAIGDAPLTALLSLSKPYFFAIPLTFLLSTTFGESGIWWASPMAELMLLALTLATLRWAARHRSLKFGLFRTTGVASR